MNLKRGRRVSLVSGMMWEDDMAEFVYGSADVWVGRAIKHLSLLCRHSRHRLSVVRSSLLSLFAFAHLIVRILPLSHRLSCNGKQPATTLFISRGRKHFCPPPFLLRYKQVPFLRAPASVMIFLNRRCRSSRILASSKIFCLRAPLPLNSIASAVKCMITLRPASFIR